MTLARSLGSSTTRRALLGAAAGFFVARRIAKAADHFPTSWPAGSVPKVMNYSVLSADLVSRKYNEWAIASGGLLSFEHHEMGFRADCDQMELVAGQIQVCSCEFGLKKDGSTRCASSEEDVHPTSGGQIKRIEWGGQVTAAKLLVKLYADNLEEIMCHEVGHTLGGDHNGGHSCINDDANLTSPGTDDVAALQAALARPASNPDPGAGPQPGLGKKKKKRGKGKKGRKKGKKKR
jgi:hypothetical protein